DVILAKNGGFVILDHDASATDGYFYFGEDKDSRIGYLTNLIIKADVVGSGYIDLQSDVPIIQEVTSGNLVLALNFNAETVTGSAGSESIYDSSISGIVGTNNGATFGAVGGENLSGAFDFEASTTDYIELTTNSSALNFTSEDFSVSFWIRPESASTQFIIGNGTSSVKGWYIARTVTAIQFITHEAGFQSATTAPASLIPNNEWHQITTTRAGAVAKIYVDGVDQTAFAATHTNLVTTTDNVFIGTRPALTNFFDGSLDEIKIWKSELTAAQVLALYRQRAESEDAFLRIAGGGTMYGDVNFADTKFVVFDKASGNGIKVDTTTPTFGFADLLGRVTSVNTGATKPIHSTYRGGIKEFEFAVNDEDYFEFHIPHDYVKGTDIFLHVHWSHIGTFVNGGTITFNVEQTYSKSHNQAAFPAPATGTYTGTASTTQYQQILSETQSSASSPTGLQIDTDDLEPDGVILMTLGISSNDITVSEGGVPNPFIHYVDIHYQTTGLIGTKQKAPDFYGDLV
ncbi:hypothetical protein LCGC14_2423830, partial [marine sediment metagenome]